MSSMRTQDGFKRRTSERRRLKLLRKSDEFRMPNPYKHSHPTPLPDALSRQLTKIDFLSASAIALLALDPNCPAPSALLSMQAARAEQELRYGRLFGCSMECSRQGGEREGESGCWSPKQENCMQLINTREEISLNLYDPQVKDELFRGSAQAVEEEEEGAVEWGGVLREPSAMLLEDYENYFLT